jgi:DNA-binding beta-propeller fold protein YncE
MLLSSHYSAEKGRNGASLLWVDWKARKIVDETPVGIQPFHMTYDPVGERVLFTSNVDGMVNVIDWKTHKVLQKLAVPKPHGIVAVGVP